MKSIILVFISVAFLFSSCQRADNLKLEESQVGFTSIQEYQNSLKLKRDSVDSDNHATFIFANNPYNINEKYVLSISLNNRQIYFGEFTNAIELNLGKIAAEDRVNISFEVLTPKLGDIHYLHRFNSKSVFFWRENYRFVYLCFLPHNQDTDRMQAFPQIQQVIQ